jgi:hypothetical protein
MIFIIKSLVRKNRKYRMDMLERSVFYRKIWICFLFFLLFTANPSPAYIFTVVNSDSLGSGSLVWALAQTQSHPGPDTVQFSLLKTDKRFNGQAWLIFIPSPLPTLVDGGTFVDGFSQSPANSNKPRIEIHGENGIVAPEGWQIRSSFNIIRGLSLGGFPNSAISLAGSEAHDNLIAGCHIGCGADGKTRLRNRLVGIECIRGSHHNTIGGETSALRNVISGNGTYGVRIEDSHDNRVIGNYIGVDASGLAALPNGDQPRQQNCAGIMLSYFAKNNWIGNGKPFGRNILSGNERTGLRIEWSGADGNTVQGNYLGLGADGKTRIPNGEAGLVIGRGASLNVIGSDSASGANVISGNYSSGVQFARASSKNIFKGNYVGTDAFLTSIVANAHNGLYFYGDDNEGYPQENIIGPANIICGNGNEPPSRYWAGLSLDNSGTTKNLFIGNYIGQDSGGKLQAGQPTGVLVQRGAHDNIFGPGNVIAHSQYDGVLVMHNTTLNNRITQNSIFDNQLQAIQNTEGGNAELKPPVLANVDSNHLVGYALPGAVVEIYSDSQDEAQQYLATVTADSLGRFSWIGTVPKDRHLNALAIDRYGNTSMLSSDAVNPVELTDFTAELHNNFEVHLVWHTASEQNNYGFWVQRKNNEAYQDIRFIAGAGTVALTQTYTVQDTLVKKGDYWYRLKQVDQEGSISFSKEIVVQVALPATLVMAQVFPNPFNSSLQVRFDLVQSASVSLQIWNLRGECVRRLGQGVLAAGHHTAVWDARDDAGSAVGSGTLFVVLKTEEHTLVQKCVLLR